MEVMLQHGPLGPRPNEQQCHAAMDFLFNDGVVPQGAQLDREGVATTIAMAYGFGKGGSQNTTASTAPSSA